MSNQNIVKIFNELDIKVESIKKLNGGLNSNVSIVNSLSSSYVFKLYPANKYDKRNRFKNELSFIKFLKKNDVNNIAKIIAADVNSRWIIFNHIKGEKIKKIDDFTVNCTLNFFEKLFLLRNKKGAEKINLSSEACFSLEEHFKIIDYRISKFNNISSKTPVHDEVSFWVKSVIKKRFQLIKSQFDIYKKNTLIDTEFAQRILSPSDVGIHNMIKSKGECFFIDFEYSGWDNVYKYLADWILRPGQEMESKYLSRFISGLSNILGREIFYKNLEILLEIYKIKWTLIILNPFLKENCTNELNLNAFIKAQNYFNNVKNKKYFN